LEGNPEFKEHNYMFISYEMELYSVYVNFFMQARRTFHSASAEYTYKFKVIRHILKNLKKTFCTKTTFENIIDDGKFNSSDLLMQQRPSEAAGDRHVKLSVQPHQTQATHSWQRTGADTLQRTIVHHS
jgi:hypothetical protein